MADTPTIGARGVRSPQGFVFLEGHARERPRANGSNVRGCSRWCSMVGDGWGGPVSSTSCFWSGTPGRPAPTGPDEPTDLDVILLKAVVVQAGVLLGANPVLGRCGHRLPWLVESPRVSGSSDQRRAIVARRWHANASSRPSSSSQTVSMAWTGRGNQTGGPGSRWDDQYRSTIIREDPNEAAGPRSATNLIGRHGLDREMLEGNIRQKLRRYCYFVWLQRQRSAGTHCQFP
jgi:hypothetical protein